MAAVTVKEQKRATGVYVMGVTVTRRETPVQVCVTVLKNTKGLWEASYRNPYSYGGITKLTRRTKALAAADAIAHLSDDEELFGKS